MTHTTGSTSFHKSHKSQGSVMTFTLSCRAVNTFPLSALQSQQKLPVDSSLPSHTISFGSTGLFCGIPDMPVSYCPFIVRLNAKHTVHNLPWMVNVVLCQVKCLTWRGKDICEQEKQKLLQWVNFLFAKIETKIMRDWLSKLLFLYSAMLLTCC